MIFNIDDYKGKYVMHCKTEEEAKDFLLYLNKIGKKWCNQSSYTGDTNWSVYWSNTVYYFNKGTYGNMIHVDRDYTILEWSDYMKRKNFTKANLESGMVVEHRNGARYLVLRDKLLNMANWRAIEDYTSELKESVNGVHPYDIVKIYDTIGVTNLRNAFYDDNLILIWERQEVKEMTVAEIEKELGYSVKIIKEK